MDADEFTPTTDPNAPDASFPRDGRLQLHSGSRAKIGQTFTPIRWYAVYGSTDLGPGLEGIMWVGEDGGIGFDATEFADQASAMWLDTLQRSIGNGADPDELFQYLWDKAARVSTYNVGPIETAPDRATAIGEAMDA